MKSFSQFLHESYLNEEEARQGKLFTTKNKPQDFRNPKKIPFTGTDPTPTPASKRLSPGAPDAPKTSPGQLEIPEPKTTRVSGSQFRNAGEARQGSLLTKSGGAQNFTKAGKGQVPFTSSEPVKSTKRLSASPVEAPKTSSGQMEIDFNARPNKSGELATRTPTSPTVSNSPSNSSLTKPQKPVEVRDVTNPRRSEADLKRRRAAAGTGPSGKSIITPPPSSPSSSSTKPSTPSAGKPPKGIKPSSAVKPGGVLRKLGKLSGPLGVAADVGLETMDQKSRGRRTGSALTIGATKATGGLIGAKAGAALGGTIGSIVPGAGTAIGAGIGALGGYLAGSGVAGKASEVVAGATGKEKSAMATANRQRQAGTTIKGIGGKTTFSQAKSGGPAFMSTGSGSQRKTVQLAKTGVVQRGAQSTAGHLAFKGGKAVYKAGPSAQSLAKTSSNPLERIGRSLFAGAYKQNDAKIAAQKLASARASDVSRNKALGVKMKPGG